MTPIAHIFVACATVLSVLGVLLLLRRKSFRERHAVWWISASVLALVVTLFPAVLDFAADLMGVHEPINLALFIAITLLFLVCVQFSSEVTGLEARARRLAEEIAIADERIGRLERRLDGEGGP